MQPGAILGEAWRLYREHWQHFLPIALVIFLILAVISLLLTLVLGVVGAIFGGLLGIVGVFWLQGALTEAVVDVRDGRADLSIGDTFRRVQPRLPAIIAAGLLAGLGIIIGLFLLIVPGLFLLTIWSLIIPAIVIEGKSSGDAFGRSRELVRGNGWSVFGVIVLSVLVVIGVAIVVGIATFWLPDSSQAFVQNLIQNTLAYPFFALVLTLTYFTLAGQASTPAMSASPPPAV
jgi:hypothetical protein